MQDYRIICKLAAKLGAGDYFSFNRPEDIFNELRRASAGGKADYSGITYERLRKERGLFWPCPAAEHPGTPLMFAERFWHPDGKAKLFGIVPGKPAETTDAEYPYVLTTGRISSHYLSGAQTRRTEALIKKAPVPVAEIHPSAASRIGLKPGERIRLTSRRGSIVLPCKVTEDIHPSDVFVPFHWGGESAINRLTNDALHPVSRMPEFKICSVRLAPVSSHSS